MLYVTTVDRQQTQLAYRVKYWPAVRLSPAAHNLICWSKTRYMSRGMIESLCDETRNKLTYNGRDYNIVWAYNNMPTQAEWEGKSKEFLIRVELRSSPAIDVFAVAILNFELANNSHLE